MAKLYFNTTAFVLEAHRKAIPARATQPIENAIQREVVRRRPVDERHIIKTCIGGQFLIETRAGRDGFSAAFLKHIERVNSRHGLDGLFLTVLSHLAHTQSPSLEHALQLWASTPLTAGNSEVAFDCRTGIVHELKKSAFDSKHDPLKGSRMELPAFQQEIMARLGGELMSISCQQWFTAAATLAGAALGAYGGGAIGAASTGGSPAGAIGGAIGGGLGGSSAGKDVGDSWGPIFCGWAEGDSGSSTEGDAGGGGAPRGPSTEGDAGGGAPRGPSTEGDAGGGSDPSGPSTEDNDGGGDNDDYPAPDGYPNPDDTGGDPWSVVELTSFMTLEQATQLMTPVRGGGYSIKALASINTGANALSPSLSLIEHLNLAITGKSVISDINLKALAVDLQGHGIEAKKFILR